MAESTPEETPAEPQAGQKADTRARRRTARLARQIRAFGAAHGSAPVDVTIEYIGARGARLVLVAEDGAWGDLVAPSYAMAQAAAAGAGATVHEDFAGEPAGRVRTGPYEWSRMAGLQIGGPAGN